MINGIRLELIRQGLLKRIAPSLRRELDLAALRTAANLTRKGEEQNTNKLGFTIGSVPYVSKLELGHERLRRDIIEAAFLPYEQCAAEQDAIRLGRALAAEGSLTVTLRQKFRSMFRSKGNARRLRLLFVFDELDKLEQSADEDGIAAFNDILRDLKSLLTTSGVTFLFIAGRGIYDAWEKDVERGDSLYDSVFSHIEYIPALWQIGDELCNQLLKPEAPLGNRDLADFKDYLSFKGRGIPRRTLRAFQESVQIDGDARACLTFEGGDLRRFQCVAELERHVKVAQRILPELRGGRSETDRLDNDGLALRYLADWIVESGHTPFGIAELSEACSRLNQLVAPRDDALGIVPRQLVRALESAGFLEAAFGVDKLLSAVVNQDVSIKQWRVPRRRLIELGRNLSSQGSAHAAGYSIAGRYLVSRLISQGLLSTIYEAVDQISDRVVVIKCFTPNSFRNDNVMRWFNQNERNVMSLLSHSRIPQLISAELENDPPFLVMELAGGVPLDRLLRDRRQIDWEVAVMITQKVLVVLDYIHTRGIIWGDLKPSNIVVEDADNVRLLDFGAARFIKSGGEEDGIPVIGTPQFMAPECLGGKRSSVSSDVFAGGVMLYQMTTGVFPFVGDSMRDLLGEIRHKPPIPPGSLFDMPKELELAILRCLEIEPEQRFKTVGELSSALPRVASDRASEEIHRMVSNRPTRESGTVPGTQAATMPVSTTRTLSNAGPASVIVVSEPSIMRAKIDARATTSSRADDKVQCGHGHYFDSRKHSYCPYCPVPSLILMPPPQDVGGPPVGALVSPIGSEESASGKSNWDADREHNSRVLVYAKASDVQVDSELSLDTTEPSRRQYLLVRGISARIGRSSDNEIRIEDDEVSRYHSRLEYSSGNWFIRTLNGLNGTMVDGIRIQDKCKVGAGTEITIGKTQIRVNAAR